MVEYFLLNWAFPRLVTSFRCRIESLLHDANSVQTLCVAKGYNHNVLVDNANDIWELWNLASEAD